ncbi:hypothetical protein BDN71DRAFT_1433452 [Pleurotus eryngii]|uniref:DUF6570 domain-containing protein n=1 Tax=Pleurotus eryngii TaxID=5323 RepID=A0A9P5ZPM8_PLEER|nr:hypothetical protein BDN71DRAFT_1433452 [Pleurotus eryngii]
MSGLKGNITTYPLDVQVTASFIDGNHLPPHPHVLAMTISITFISVKNIPLKVLQGTFSICRDCVPAALLWLKVNNPLYHSIIIDEVNLVLLPGDDVPLELQQIVKTSDNIEMLEKEQGSYVPYDCDNNTSTVMPTTNVSTSAVGNKNWLAYSSAISKEDHGSGEDAEVIPLQALEMIDMEDASISNSELLTQALKNMAQDIACSDNAQVKHGLQPVNDIHGLYKDSRGAGMHTDKRSVRDSASALMLRPPSPAVSQFRREQVRLVCLEGRARGIPKHDLQFIFQVFGVLKHKIAHTAVVQIEHSAYVKHTDAISRLTTQDFALASEEEATKKPFSNLTMMAFQKQITALCSQVMGTDESRHEVRAQIWGTTLVNGPPSV